jgi:Bacterial regulatory proteins, luxR family
LGSRVFRVAVLGSLTSRHTIVRRFGAFDPGENAAKLGISSWTVSPHLRRMVAKFDVRSRAALITRLLEEELVLDDRRLFPRWAEVAGARRMGSIQRRCSVVPSRRCPFVS